MELKTMGDVIMWLMFSADDEQISVIKGVAQFVEDNEIEKLDYGYKVYSTYKDDELMAQKKEI